jgi:hypothetical protein
LAVPHARLQVGSYYCSIEKFKRMDEDAQPQPT